MVRPTRMEVEWTKHDEFLDNISRVEYDEASESLTDPPRGMFRMWNPGGVQTHALEIGDEIYIRRNNERRFHSHIETPTPANDEEEGAWITFDLIQKGYRLLQSAQCTSYDYDEDGDPSTTRDGVTINPWNFFAFRDPDGSLDANGERPAINGVNYADALRMVIGVKCIHQIDFRDNRFLLASQAYANSGNVSTYRDKDDTRPLLQRVRNGQSSFKAGDTIESIPLYNGDPNIGAGMGTISTVSVTIIGEHDGTNDVEIELCRDADQSTRTYTTVTLSRTDNYQGSNLSAWEGSVDLSNDGGNADNELGFRIKIPGTSGDSSTTKVHYIKLDADTTSDTNVTEGTINTYSNPVTFTNNAEDLVITDLLGFNRLKAAETLRTQTESDEANNPSPHWDAWIDHSEQFHFKERRGEVKTNLEYSLRMGTMTSVRRERYGGDLAYQTVAYGAGSGTSQTRIVDRSEFSNGGLYDSDRDPNAATDPKYGDQAGVHTFIDQNENNPTNLFRKARAVHKLVRNPQVSFSDFSIESEYIPYFNVGDSLPVFDPKTGTDANLRVLRLTRKWTPENGEDLEPKIGEPTRDFAQRLRGAKDKADTVTLRPQPNAQSSGLSGAGLPFDASHYGKYTFGVDQGSLIKRVFLEIETLPWQAMAKQGAAGGDHTHSVDVTHPSHNHDVTHPSHSHDVSTTSGSGGGGISNPTTKSDANDPVSISDGGSNTWSFDIPTAQGNGLYAFVEIETVGDGEMGIEITVDNSNESQITTWAGGLTPSGGTDEFQLPVIIPDRYEGGTISITVTNRTGSSSDVEVDVRDFWERDDHTHSVSDTSTAALGTTETSTTALGTTNSETSDASGDHTHPLDFGIYQFDGDAGDGTGDPLYGQGIQLAVDPATDSAGIPNNFSSDRLPHTWGDEAAPSSIEVEITGHLSTDAQGVIENGEHEVFFQSGTTASNGDGLAVVSVTPRFVYKEPSQA